MSRFKPSENDVKKLVKAWFDSHDAWSFAPIQTGMGVHGLPDRIGCVPVTITQEMVGMEVGLFVGVECKAPGRRGEPRGGASELQVKQLRAISDSHGIAMMVDNGLDVMDLNGAILSVRYKGVDPSREYLEGRLSYG